MTPSAIMERPADDIVFDHAEAVKIAEARAGK